MRHKSFYGEYSKGYPNEGISDVWDRVRADLATILENKQARVISVSECTVEINHIDKGGFRVDLIWVEG